MNMILGLGIAVMGVLILMGYITLKSKLNGLEERIRATNVSLNGQAWRVIAEIQERGQFNDKALGQLAENVAACGYEVKEVKDKLETSTKELKEDIKKSTHTLATTPLKIQV